MSERGIVIKVSDDGETAVVEFNRTEACAKCRACLAGFKESKMVLEAKNSASAKEGDAVFVELPPNGLLSASVIMYVFPLAAMFAGFFAGIALAGTLNAKADTLAFCLGIGLLALSLLIIRLNEKKLKTLPVFAPRITRIADASGDF